MFNIGDKVKVINTNHEYERYAKWVNQYAPRYLYSYLTEGRLGEGDTGTIVAAWPSNEGDRRICLVDSDTSNRTILISDRGIQVEE